VEFKSAVKKNTCINDSLSVGPWDSNKIYNTRSFSL